MFIIIYSLVQEKQITSQFLSKEREEQIKRETVTSKLPEVDKEIIKTDDGIQEVELKQQVSEDISSSIKSKEVSSFERIESIIITTPDEEILRKSEDIRLSDDKKLATEHKKGPAGEDITITTITEILEGPTGDEIEKITVTESTKHPSGKETVSVKVSENIRSHKIETVLGERESKVEDVPSIDEETRKQDIAVSKTTSEYKLDEKGLAPVTESLKAMSGSLETSIEQFVDDTVSKKLGKKDEPVHEIQAKSLIVHKKDLDSEQTEIAQDKQQSTTTESKIGKLGEEITITTVTENLTGSSVERIGTTITESVKYPSGKETVSTKISECIKSEKIDIIPDTIETQVSDKSLDKTISSSVEEKHKREEVEIPAKDEKMTTSTETVIGSSGEEISTTTVTVTKILPNGEEAIKTTTTINTKYPSGRQTVSTKVSESIRSHKEVVFTTSASEISQSEMEDKLQSMISKSKSLTDEEETSVDTKEQTRTGPSGEKITTTIVTETTKIPMGDKVKTTITEVTRFPSGEESISTKISESIKTFEQDIETTSVKESKDSIKLETVDQGEMEAERPEAVKKIIFSESEDSKEKTESSSESKTPALDLSLKDSKEVTKEQIKPVIDDILQKGTTVAATRSPTLEKDIKLVSKEILETERRSYDAKVPQKDERRHSCISPAISLERIAESEVEMEDEDKVVVVTTETSKEDNAIAEMKKSDSAMKQMADNIEIIIKQASEDLDLSSEEPVLEEKKPTELQGEVSVDSIIEEAVQTVEGYFEEASDLRPEHKDVKKEVMVEDTKPHKERPGLVKSLSRDSGEVAILPKKKQPRTFSVQSSPDEVEEQIYTDSESGE